MEPLRRLLASTIALLPFGATKAVGMTGQNEKSDAARLAIKNPPGCIADFDVQPIVLDDPGSVGFRLICRACRFSRMRILCYPKLVAEGDDYAGLKVGDLLERDPHDVVCIDCGESHIVFDQGKNGYDGVLGNGRTYEAGDGEIRPIVCDEDSYHVEVIFTFNIEFGELKEIETEDGVAIQDLFDGFSIRAVSEDGSELKSIDYECA